MNTYDSRRPNLVATEQLLRQAGVTAPATRLLVARLAAASVAGLPSELTGESAATAAFHAGRDVTDPPRRASMIKTALAKVLTVKAAAILAALSAGGVALAATTGVLPNPLGENPATTPSHPVTTPHAGGNGGQGGPGGSDATPDPSLPGLCTAFLAGAGSEHGKALENPAFTVLITAAGGVDGVEAYCATLQHSGGPADHPTGAPASHPGSTEHPNGKPSKSPEN
jgi:hypothetical protein